MVFPLHTIANWKPACSFNKFMFLFSSCLHFLFFYFYLPIPCSLFPFICECVYTLLFKKQTKMQQTTLYVAFKDTNMLVWGHMLFYFLIIYFFILNDKKTVKWLWDQLDKKWLSDESNVHRVTLSSVVNRQINPSIHLSGVTLEDTLKCSSNCHIKNITVHYFWIWIFAASLVGWIYFNIIDKVRTMPQQIELQ